MNTYRNYSSQSIIGKEIKIRTPFSKVSGSPLNKKFKDPSQFHAWFYEYTKEFKIQHINITQVPNR